MNRMAAVQGRDPKASIRTAIPEGGVVTTTDPTSPVASYLTKAAYAMGKKEYEETAYNLALALIGAVTGVGDEIRALRESVERLSIKDDE